MWRWSWHKVDATLIINVFSTYVEVILSSSNIYIGIKCFLHVCGGDPKVNVDVRLQSAFSPRMWRWSCSSYIIFPMLNVFSTYVEVIPIASSCLAWLACFLHVCGGDPMEWWKKQKNWLFSPRMWRWSWSIGAKPYPSVVFSTYVEVILALNILLISD